MPRAIPATADARLHHREKNLQVSRPKVCLLPPVASRLLRPHGKVSKAIRVEPISTQPFVLITPDQGAVPKELILYDRATWEGRLCQDWIAWNTPREEVICEMDDRHVIAALVATGLGCALVPQWAGLVKITGLRIIPAVGTPIRDVVLATRGKSNRLIGFY